MTSPSAVLVVLCSAVAEREVGAALARPYTQFVAEARPRIEYFGGRK